MRVQSRQIVAEIIEIVRDGSAGTATATATAAAVAAKQNAVLNSIDGIEDYVYAEVDVLPRSVATEESTVYHDVLFCQSDVHR